MTLTTLLPRLESGEASRELDALLAQALDKPDDLLNGMRFDEAIERFPRDLAGIANYWPIPPYTTSLDAALALAERVLPGWAWMVRGSHCDGDGASFAKVWRPYADPPAGDFDALAHTAPLALCAAIVKAKLGEVG